MAVTIRNNKELGEAIRAELLRRNLRQVDPPCRRSTHSDTPIRCTEAYREA